MTDAKDLTPYRRRCLEQDAAWLAGRPMHNAIDNECCADFSCCVPRLFTADREERLRMVNATRTKFSLGERHDA